MRKQSTLIVLGCILCFGLVLNFFTYEIIAQDDYYKIEIKDKNYNIQKIKELNDQTIIYYDLYINLSNVGTIDSENMTIEILGDDEIPLYRQAVIPAGETVEFFWTEGEYFLIGAMDHYINISYYPTDPKHGQSEDNTGIEQLILKYSNNKNTGSTPGFEIIFVVISISIFVFFRKYKNI